MLRIPSQNQPVKVVEVPRHLPSIALPFYPDEIYSHSLYKTHGDYNFEITTTNIGADEFISDACDNCDITTFDSNGRLVELMINPGSKKVASIRVSPKITGGDLVASMQIETVHKKTGETIEFPESESSYWLEIIKKW